MVDFLSYFYNQPGLIALAALIPFIIVYLIKPKPVDKPIPSLMFLLKDTKVSNQRSLFRTFMRNLLFLLQLLALLALAFAIAQPFIELSGKGSAQATVIVLDSSASMKTQFNGATRFDAAKSQALSAMSGRVTLITAEHAPFVLLDKGSKGEAQRILAKLTAHDTQSAIGDAMLLAGDYAAEGTKIIAYSDFAYTTGTEPIIAAQTLRARGFDIELRSIGQPEDNTGFVNLILDKDITKAYVKNYGGENKAINVIYYNNDKKTKEVSHEILPNSVEIFEFPTTQGTNRMEIQSADSNPSDNKLYTSVPDLKKVNVLLISNIDADKESSVKTCSELNTRLSQLKKNKKLNEQYALVRILSALSSVNRITCDYVFPPILPDPKSLQNYDIIIMYKFNEREVTPVSYRDIGAAVKSGTHLIVTADKSVTSPDLAQMLPVVPGNSQTGNLSLSYNSVAITKNVNLDTVTVKKIITASLKNGSEVIASANGNPVLARMSYGNGTVFYYGLLEDFSDFQTLPDYVIFWGQLITDLTSSVDLSEYNYHTGTYVLDGSEKKLLEDSGITTVGDKTVAANLLSDKESDTTSIPQVEAEPGAQGGTNTSQKNQIPLEYYLIIAALVFISLEFIYVKMRGEI